MIFFFNTVAQENDFESWKSLTTLSGLLNFLQCDDFYGLAWSPNPHPLHTPALRERERESPFSIPSLDIILTYIQVLEK